MNKEKISSRQGLSILIMFTLGSTLILSPWKEAGKDGWISIFIAMIMIIPMYYVYSRLVSIFPGKDLFDLQQELFGKIAGKITSFFLVWYSIHLCAIINRNMSEFIQTMSFAETPLFTIALVGAVLFIWIVKGGIEVIGRYAAFMMPITILSIIITSILVIPKMDIDNLRPVMYNGLTPVLRGAATLFGFPFAETFLFTMVFNSLENKNKTFKIYLLGLLISGLLFISTSVRNVAALGEKLNTALYFPSYVAVALINILDFIDRIEVLVGATFIFSGFLKCSICLYTACRGLAKIFNIKDYKQITAPVGLLVFITSVFIYKSTMEMFDWAAENYIYYVIPFSVILPIVTLTAAKIRGGSKI